MLRRLRQHLHRKPWRSSPLNACGCQQHPSNSCSHEYSESGLSEWRRYLAPQTAIRQRIETRARLDEKATQKGFGSDLRLQSTPYLRKRRLRCSFFRESCSDVRTLSLSLSLIIFVSTECWRQREQSEVQRSKKWKHIQKNVHERLQCCTVFIDYSNITHTCIIVNKYYDTLCKI